MASTAGPMFVWLFNCCTGFPGGIAGLFIRGTDPSATGDYLRNLKFYMLADETDLLAGKVFRFGGGSRPFLI